MSTTTVRDMFKKVKAKAIQLGVPKQFLNIPIFLDLYNEAASDFQRTTEPNEKQAYTTTIEDQEYYILPSDFKTIIHGKLDGKSFSGLTTRDYLLYKEQNT